MDEISNSVETELPKKFQRFKAICLIGIDGSGKTTHAVKILSKLKESGVKCKYVWFGTPYFFSYPFMTLCRLLGFTETHHLQNGITTSEHQYDRNKPLARVYPWVQFFDLSIFTFLKVRLALFLGYAVVCDRFVYDMLSEMMADVNDKTLHRRLVGRLITKLAPKSAAVFLLDLNERTAFRRRLDVPNLEYLARRRANLKLIAQLVNVSVIDANKSFSSVRERIINSLHPHNGQKDKGNKEMSR